MQLRLGDCHQPVLRHDPPLLLIELLLLLYHRPARAASLLVLAAAEVEDVSLLVALVPVPLRGEKSHIIVTVR